MQLCVQDACCAELTLVKLQSLCSILSAADAYAINGVLVWEVYARYGDDSNYDFNYLQVIIDAAVNFQIEAFSVPCRVNEQL